MKTRFLGLGAESGFAGERPVSPYLTVGRDYVVLAILVPSDRPTEFLILTDQDDPSWFPASQFDLVSADVPTSWKILVGEGGSAQRIEIAPEPWLSVGYWSDYWGDDHLASLQAKEIFAHELDVILRETG